MCCVIVSGLYSDMNLGRGLCAQIAGLMLIACHCSFGAENTGLIDLSITNNSKHLQLPLVSGVDEFRVLRTTNLAAPFSLAPAGTVSGYNWVQPGQGELEFFRVELQPKDPQSVVSANILNRIAYGPTPDDLNRLNQIGPDAYIQEQLAPETIVEDLEIDRVIPPGSDWQYVTQTGTASSTTALYIYLTTAGECYLDDIKLVRGGVAEAGTSVLSNGDFEAGFTGWIVDPIYSNSVIVTDIKHGGTSSLHLIGTEAGSSSGTSVRRNNLSLSSGQTYTLSYWYKAVGTRTPPLVIRLSGDGIRSSPGTLATRLADGSAILTDLSAWHVAHAVESQKQLLEVMLQWLENHFVTQHRKSREYMDNRVPEDTENAVATNLEFRELQRWRAALHKPNVTFRELLTISAESPAMIIYLDTVNSRGDGTRIANENYAREILELFTFGVDNGYDQNDITVLSRVWTGWSVRIVDPANEFNPFARQSTTLLPGGTNVSRTDNLEGIWAFNYRPEWHHLGTKVLFPQKTVPARFGAPYAGKNYELRVGAGASTEWQYVVETGTASSSTIYLYITGTGECYVDDIKIVPGTTPEVGINAVRNGDFETGLTGWTVSPMVSGSAVSSTVVHSGAGALRLVSTGVGAGSSTSIRRADLGLAIGQPYTLSYWYKAGTNLNGNLVIRLSESGINSTPGGGTNTIQEGYTVIEHLADQPFTQEFISVKLCRLFVHDDFATGYDFTDPNLSAEGKLVRACMRAWEENMPKGQIRKVLEVIFNSELFRSQDASMQKVKTPFEFTVAAVRALRARMEDGTYTAGTDGYSIATPLNRMGRMRLFDREEPDGYPESGVPWISAGTLTERLRFVQSLLLAANASGKSDAGASNVTDPVRLLKAKLPQTSWNNAAAVADYFVTLLYPSEGRANLDEYRQLAIWYLNTADDGVATSAFSALSNTTTTYDTRVRGMIAMLMTFPRYQEQ